MFWLVTGLKIAGTEGDFFTAEKIFNVGFKKKRTANDEVVNNIKLNEKKCERKMVLKLTNDN